MKKIICPTDFSEAANNAIEYAAKLAQKINAELEIINVQLISATSPVLSSINAKQSATPTSEVLQRMCDDIHKTFKIFSTYKVETTNGTLEGTIKEASEKNNLIVIGTNGIDDIYQYFFGTNTYHIIKKAKCPVLVVPEGVSYGAIKKIVFAWDYNRSNKASFFQLKEVMNIDDKAEITFLHASEEKTPVSNDVFRAIQDDVYSSVGYKEKIRFERIWENDTELLPDKIDEYVKDNGMDLLVITYYDRGILKNIFHGAISKKLSETADYPLLVLHA